MYVRHTFGPVSNTRVSWGITICRTPSTIIATTITMTTDTAITTSKSANRFYQHLSSSSHLPPCSILIPEPVSTQSSKPPSQPKPTQPRQVRSEAWVRRNRMLIFHPSEYIQGLQIQRERARLRLRDRVACQRLSQVAWHASSQGNLSSSFPVAVNLVL